MLNKTIAALAIATTVWAMPSMAQQVPTEQGLRDRNAVLLGNQELQELLNNRTIYHRNYLTGQQLPIYFDAQSGLRFFRRGGNAVTKTEWEIRDGRRCEETTGGAMICMAIYRHGDSWSYCDPRDGGECRWQIIRSVAGDPEGLKQ